MVFRFYPQTQNTKSTAMRRCDESRPSFPPPSLLQRNSAPPAPAHHQSDQAVQPNESRSVRVRFIAPVPRRHPAYQRSTRDTIEVAPGVAYPRAQRFNEKHRYASRQEWITDERTYLGSINRNCRAASRTHPWRYSETARAGSTAQSSVRGSWTQRSGYCRCPSWCWLLASDCSNPSNTLARCHE